MKLQSATIKDFKRFTHLTIHNIPASARLIMLAGPNGCGKSSLFDAFNIWHQKAKRPRYSPNWQTGYHNKIMSLVYELSSQTEAFHDQVDVTFHNGLPESEEEKKKIFYMRSAYRNDPEFRIQNLHRVGSSLDEERVQRMIDNDAVVSSNYQRMVAQSLDGLFDRQHDQLTVPELREQIIGEIRDALVRVFPDIELHSLEHPLEDGTYKVHERSQHRVRVQKSFWRRESSI